MEIRDSIMEFEISLRVDKFHRRNAHMIRSYKFYSLKSNCAIFLMEMIQNK